MAEENIIVIGAGAAGLIAARELSRAGKRVVILEARRRPGGRIYTFRDKKFKEYTEGGAEFVHGKLETTMSLLKEYKIKFTSAKGNIWHVKNNDIEKDKDIITEHHHLLRKKLKALKRDVPLRKFLDRHFKGIQYDHVRKDITGFVEGYESASIDTFSTFAFREDWLEAEEWQQFRIENGYGSLINSLVSECKSNGCRVVFGSVVNKVRWKKGMVEIFCANGRKYIVGKCVIAVPLGLLHQKKITFSPTLPEKYIALKNLGYGNVIKIILLFKTKFWEEEAIKKSLDQNVNKLFFLFSDEVIPTWWTQHPSDSSLLIGWFSGPEAKKNATKTNKQILHDALTSLSHIFKLDKKQIRLKLDAWKIVNWVKDEYSLGSYSYATVNSDKYKKQVNKSEESTLYFAGEYLEEPSGTVEGALKSGLKVAEKILQS